MLRAVADTNVVVSALLWRGAPHRLFAGLDSGRIELFASQALLAELEGVLERRKLAPAVNATGSSAATLVSRYRALVRLVAPRTLTAPASRDPDDDAVIACAIAARARIVVSGDKDLRVLGSHGSIRIVSPAEALRLVSLAGRGGPGKA